ncbi:hypothetical protein D3C76_857340 [compost metagenome]
MHQAQVTHVLEPRIVDIQMFQAPTPFLTVERALAEFALGGANRFHRHGGIHQPGVVVDAAEILQVLEVALALVEDVLLEALVDLEVSAGRVRRQRQVAFGGSASGQHVFAGAGPDVADDVVHREAETRSGLDRHRGRHAPGAQEHPVRVELTDLPPLRRLLIARIGHRNLDVLEPVLLGQQLERPQGFATVCGVVVDRGDFLALEFVEATLSLGDVVDQAGGFAVEGQHHREVVREHRAVGGFGAAITQGDQRNPVDFRPFTQGIGRRRAVRLIDRYGRAIQAVLEALVALDALLRRPFGFAFLPNQFHPIDPAFDLVDVVEVIDHPGPHLYAAGGVGADPVSGQRKELLVRRGLGHRYCTAENRQRQSGAEQGAFQGCTHVVSLVVGRIQKRSGQWPSRSRRLPSRRIKPSGSLIRNRMISTPKMIFCRFCSCPASTAPPSKACPTWLSRIGNRLMNAAPTKLPAMLPMPPIMMMNRIWNDRLISKLLALAVPR